VFPIEPNGSPRNYTRASESAISNLRGKSSAKYKIPVDTFTCAQEITGKTVRVKKKAIGYRRENQCCVSGSGDGSVNNWPSGSVSVILTYGSLGPDP
jgi:hypothetical protein